MSKIKSAKKLAKPPGNDVELSAKDKSAIDTVQRRIKDLQKDNEMLEQIIDDQIGTEIPKVFTSRDRNFIVDPSNVGTGILDRMIKTDDTINSAVQFKIMMILSKVGEYAHAKPKIKKLVQSFLQELREPTWASSQEAMLSYHGYKFSVSEISFRLNKELQKIPRKISTYHPSTLAFEADENGGITPDGILQYTQQRSQFANVNFRFQAITHGFKVNNPFTTPIDRLHPIRVPIATQLGLVRIPLNKVIHFKGQEWHGFGNPYGNGGVRTAHLLWQLKGFILKQLGIASKRKSSPKIWGTAPKGAQQVEITNPDGTKEQVSPTEALRKMLKDIQDFDNIVTHSEADGYKLTVLEDTADLSQFVAVINALNTWIFRCFLLPSLVLTDGQAGSRSLGDKHFQIVDRIAESDADKFGETVINQMIERVIIENFGEQDDYGQFLRRPQTIEERQRLASMFGQLGNDGWISPAVEQDMSFVRDSLNLTPVEDGFFTAQNELDFDNDGIPPGGTIPDDKPPVDDSPIEGGEENHSQNAFNGAQVTSLVDLIKQVSLNEIPADAAIEILVSAFQMERATAEKIIKSAKEFKPESITKPPAPDPKEKPPEPPVDAKENLSILNPESILTPEGIKIQSHTHISSQGEELPGNAVEDGQIHNHGGQVKDAPFSPGHFHDEIKTVNRTGPPVNPGQKGRVPDDPESIQIPLEPDADKNSADVAEALSIKVFGELNEAFTEWFNKHNFVTGS